MSEIKNMYREDEPESPPVPETAPENENLKQYIENFCTYVEKNYKPSETMSNDVPAEKSIEDSINEMKNKIQEANDNTWNFDRLLEYFNSIPGNKLAEVIASWYLEVDPTFKPHLKALAKSLGITVGNPDDQTSF